jgi:ATP-dependent helicase HrpA
VLNRVRAEGFDWQVPGLREELVTELIRSLPKALRRSFVPAGTYAAPVLAAGGPADGPLAEVAARALTGLGGPRVAAADFDLDRVPDHLRITFRVEDEAGRPLGSGRDLAELQRSLAPTAAARVSQAAAEVERTGLTAWDFGPLPDAFERSAGRHLVRGHPALVDEGRSVALKVLPTEREARAATRVGVRRLVLLNTPSPVRALVSRLDQPAKLALATSAYASVPALLDDCVAAAVDSLVAEQGGTPADAAEFALLLETVRPALHARSHAVVVAVADALAAAGALRLRLDSPASPALADTWVDLRLQLRALVPDGFVSSAGWPRVAAIARYLQAALVRADRAAADAARDRDRMAEVQVLEDDLADWLASVPSERREDDAVTEVRWMIEELRVSLFAPGSRTAYPVSAKRIRKAMSAAWPAGGRMTG